VEPKRDAQHRGWSIHKVYRGKGQSEMKIKRPGLDALIGDCRQRKAGLGMKNALPGMWEDCTLKAGSIPIGFGITTE